MSETQRFLSITRHPPRKAGRDVGESFPALYVSTPGGSVRVVPLDQRALIRIIREASAMLDDGTES